MLIRLQSLFKIKSNKFSLIKQTFQNVTRQIDTFFFVGRQILFFLIFVKFTSLVWLSPIVNFTLNC